MGAGEVAYRTGWIVALLVGMQVSLGLFRVRALPAASGLVVPTRKWMRGSHAVIGFALPVLTLMHSRASMKGPAIRAVSAAGLWMATLAMLMMIVPAVLGMTILLLSKPQRSGLHRVHLSIAALVVVLAGVPMALDG